MDKSIQFENITAFCNNANYYMVKYESKDSELGKILKSNELPTINLKKNEIYRSLKYENDDLLFVYDLKIKDINIAKNPLQLLLDNLGDARAIEMVYPKIFTWIYDGLSIKSIIKIPSSNPKAHSTISRYGGTHNFFKILYQHLNNITDMKRGVIPNFNFSNINFDIPETELSIGSINKKTDMYSIVIDLYMNYKDIINASKKNKSRQLKINLLNMKYWVKEINPDFISEAKHIKLKDTIPFFDEVYTLYPLPIQRIMNLKHKGNFNRYLLSRFLLSIHSPKDAKFIYYSVLGDEERDHVKHGNCSTQWNYIKNNLSKYSCPTLKEVSQFIKSNDPPLIHLLEDIQDFLNNTKEEKNE